MKSYSELDPSSARTAKELLKNLLLNLETKKSTRRDAKLIPDEEMIHQALAHPERGDVEVILVDLGHSQQLFLGNRRDAENPFAVMPVSQMRDFPGRRLLDGEQNTQKADTVALFLITVQDRELLRTERKHKYVFYSMHLGITGDNTVARSAAGPTGSEGLRSAVDSQKTVAEMTPKEQWELIKNGDDFDRRVKEAREKLFTIPFIYPKYRQGPREEIIRISPEHYQDNVRMLARDIYPPNVMAVLRRDYPKDHQAQKTVVIEKLQAFKEALKTKILDDVHPDYQDHIKSVQSYVEHLVRDELSKI
ncbi:MAG TPA: hypothetical protein DEA96_19470 [Leptospiraceae bacterium]|nr:hypothetical protein [Spirochaetaceae bacterium]HBS07162.1 hypothetical protein [Leptospiraceae bacterium]|tara:strand:+ start:58683 stop:59600 length:918 start_codon:yes stop_codon:yes gene_type:complete